MRRFRNLFVCGIVVTSILAFFNGCATRSISNSGYHDSYYGYDRDSMYKGELSEFNILGIDPNETTTNDQITQAYAANHRVELKPSDSILLIQSGAMFPDEPMQRELSKYFHVIPFNGTAGSQMTGSNLSKTLRLTAAQGRCNFIACYWGVLETAQNVLATKGVSWVPVVGNAIPDKTQQMRIRLKLALVDARTGAWTIIAPEPFAMKSASARVNRESSDQTQVNTLKEKAYTALAEQLHQFAMKS